MSNQVRCTVSDCQYWAHDNYCAASSILITHGVPVIEGTEERADVRGRNFRAIEGTPIEGIEDSYCYTFIRKGP